MAKVLLFIPSEEAIDRSLDARKCVNRLSRRMDVDRRLYDAAADAVAGSAAFAGEFDSVAVLSGLSALEFESGYMEMALDTIFKPQELLGKLRQELPEDFPVVAIVDDAYSDYIMSPYLKAGASAVVGTNGDLFGLITSRVRSLDQLFPYLNVFRRV